MYTDYINCIKDFINTDIIYWQFKQNPHYTSILEHTSYNFGIDYLNIIKNNFEDFYNQNKNFLIKLCEINDSIGNPLKYNFLNFTECSPSNLRYILHSILILKYIQECNLNDINIIEIGGGYGGLCFFINRISSLFNIKINSYSFFDLEMPLLLQEKYLKYLNITNINFENLDNIKNIKNNSFLISNYAFSEITNELQMKYIEKLLNEYTLYGFLVWNSIPFYKFLNDKEFIIKDEYPQTAYGNLPNKYIYFKPLI